MVLKLLFCWIKQKVEEDDDEVYNMLSEANIKVILVEDKKMHLKC